MFHVSYNNSNLQKTQQRLYKHFTQMSSSILNLQIDKNFSLKIQIKQTKYKVIFNGAFLYHNGCGLKLSQNNWELIYSYLQLDKSQFIFLYNFDTKQISITSKFDQPHKKQLLLKLKASQIKKIFLTSQSFIDILYKYKIVNLSGRFFFRQIFKQHCLKRKIHSKLLSKNIELPKQKRLQKKEELNKEQAYDLADQQKKQQNSNIKLCPIFPVPNQQSVSRLPNHLVSGPKNLKYNLPAMSNGSLLVSGGFFEIKKYLVKLIKKLQSSNKFDYNSFLKNLCLNKSESFIEEVQNLFEYDIMAKKTLKQAKKQSVANQLKISKQLIIVEQINNKKHLINYYHNILESSKFKEYDNSIDFNSAIQQYSSQILTSGESNISQVQQKQTKLIKEQIFMDYHPQTLKDIIDRKFNSREELIQFCVQAFETTSDLHQSFVIHRDLKPQNILIDFNSNKNYPIIKVIDFSQSAILYIDQNNRKQKASISKNLIAEIFDNHNSKLYGSTFPYSPPQCRFNRQKRTDIGVNSFKIDSWSLGIIIAEIYSGKKLINYAKPYAEDMINVVRDGSFEIYCSKFNKRGFRLIEAFISYFAAKNIHSRQDMRLDVQKGFEIMKIIDESYKKWRKSILKYKKASHLNIGVFRKKGKNKEKMI